MNSRDLEPWQAGGLACGASDSDAREIGRVEERRVLCSVSTPFQLMGLLCFLSAPENQGWRVCDAVIWPVSTQMRDAAERLRGETVFDNVEVGTWRGFESRHMGMRMLFRKRAIRKDFEVTFPRTSKEEYDTVICANPLFGYRAMACCTHAWQMILLDDGSGSHNGNMFKSFAFQDDILRDDYSAMDLKDGVKKTAKLLARSVPLLDRRCNARELWLFEPTADERAIYKNIDVHAIPIPENTGMLRRVLSPELHTSLYAQLDCILLTTSRKDNPEVKAAEVAIAEQLGRDLGGRFGIRLHPDREPMDFESCAEFLLPSNDFWELLLMDGAITKDTLLVGHGSSCMFHPKELCGLEPRLAFLLDMVPGSSGVASSPLRMSVEVLKRRYRHKDRISIPKSYPELLKLVG